MAMLHNDDKSNSGLSNNINKSSDLKDNITDKNIDRHTNSNTNTQSNPSKKNTYTRAVQTIVELSNNQNIGTNKIEDKRLEIDLNNKKYEKERNEFILEIKRLKNELRSIKDNKNEINQTETFEQNNNFK